MKRMTTLLWATDNIQIGSKGARHFIKFSLPATSKRPCLEFYAESYGNLDELLDRAITFVCDNDANVKIVWENKNRGK